MRTRIGSPIYNSMWQLRRDVWSRMEEVSSRFAECGVGSADASALVERVRDQLNTLEPMEHYWGFPGRQRFQQLQRLLAVGDTAAFAQLVTDINRALVSDSYRRDDDSGALRHPGDHGKPYFEVLVVEDMTEAQERELREELRMAPTRGRVHLRDRGRAQLRGRGHRRADQLHHPGVRHPAAVRHTGPSRTCPRSDWRSTRSSSSRKATTRQADHRAQALARRLHDPAGARPVPDDRDRARGRRRAARPPLPADLPLPGGHARAAPLSLPTASPSGIEAPFFNALQQYSHRPTGVFHALPISQGKSIVNSHWIKDMIDFYGLDIFLAETSATCGGLDSLLEPTGPLRDAQDLAAETFGSRQTYFATNGTSTANKIVVAGAACSPATSCWSTATATSRTTTG